MSQSNVTRDSWKQILASAVAIFADLEKKGFGSPDVVIGGGTVLMFRFEHRLSKDIDFFLHDVQWLSLLTPRLNDTTAAMVTHYVEQASGIKLALPHGDIDFVVAHPVTEAKAVATLEFMGRTFLLESTEEILAKKLFYRAARFQPRDVFDLVAAAWRRLLQESILCAGVSSGCYWYQQLNCRDKFCQLVTFPVLFPP
jgi:predicted nucleotidyltransferase component of viral defense system